MIEWFCPSTMAYRIHANICYGTILVYRESYRCTCTVLHAKNSNDCSVTSAESGAFGTAPNTIIII